MALCFFPPFALALTTSLHGAGAGADVGRAGAGVGRAGAGRTLDAGGCSLVHVVSLLLQSAP